MTRETLERILKERGAKKKNGAYPVPEGEAATLLLGGDQPSPMPGIVELSLQDDSVVLRTKKGSTTYIEYELVRGITFEPKSLADRRTGF